MVFDATGSRASAVRRYSGLARENHDGFSGSGRKVCNQRNPPGRRVHSGSLGGRVDPSSAEGHRKDNLKMKEEKMRITVCLMACLALALVGTSQGTVRIRNSPFPPISDPLVIIGTVESVEVVSVKLPRGTPYDFTLAHVKVDEYVIGSGSGHEVFRTPNVIYDAGDADRTWKWKLQIDAYWLIPGDHVVLVTELLIPDSTTATQATPDMHKMMNVRMVSYATYLEHGTSDLSQRVMSSRPTLPQSGKYRSVRMDDALRSGRQPEHRTLEQLIAEIVAFYSSSSNDK
jgi:hypothetical protein